MTQEEKPRIRFKQISEDYYKAILPDGTIIIRSYGNSFIIGVRKNGLFNYKYGGLFTSAQAAKDKVNEIYA